MPQTSTGSTAIAEIISDQMTKAPVSGTPTFMTHAQKHAHEFGFSTADEYRDAVRNALDNPETKVFFSEATNGNRVWMFDAKVPTPNGGESPMFIVVSQAGPNAPVTGSAYKPQNLNNFNDKFMNFTPGNGGLPGQHTQIIEGGMPGLSNISPQDALGIDPAAINTIQNFSPSQAAQKNPRAGVPVWDKSAPVWDGGAPPSPAPNPASTAAGVPENPPPATPQAPDQARIKQENTRLRERLAERGITGVDVVTELEFNLPDTVQNLHWQDVKQQAIEGLQTQINTASPQERAALTTKLDELRTFNARETMMYDLIEMDPRTRGTFEPLFGKSRTTGYYDAEGVLELKIKPVDQQVFGDRLKSTADVIREKSAAYGFDPGEIGEANPHLSYSFHDGQGNLFAANPADPELSARVVSGVGYTVNDSRRYLDPLTENGRAPMAVAPDRENMIRMAPDRMELRLSGTLENMNPDSVSMMVMTGAEYGASHSTAELLQQNVPHAVPVQSPLFASNDGTKKVFQHIMEGSTIGPDGYLIPPENYILGRTASNASGELGMQFFDYHGSAPGALSPATQQVLAGNGLTEDGMADLIRRTRVVSDASGAYHLEFPTTKNNAGVISPLDLSSVQADMPLAGTRTGYVASGYEEPTKNSIGNNRAVQEVLSPEMVDIIRNDPQRALSIFAANDGLRLDHHKALSTVAENYPDAISFDKSTGLATIDRVAIADATSGSLSLDERLRLLRSMDRLGIAPGTDNVHRLTEAQSGELREIMQAQNQGVHPQPTQNVASSAPHADVPVTTNGTTVPTNAAPVDIPVTGPGTTLPTGAPPVETPPVEIPVAEPGVGGLSGAAAGPSAGMKTLAVAGAAAPFVLPAAMAALNDIDNELSWKDIGIDSGKAALDGGFGLTQWQQAADSRNTGTERWLDGMQAFGTDVTTTAGILTLTPAAPVAAPTAIIAGGATLGLGLVHDIAHGLGFANNPGILGNTLIKGDRIDHMEINGEAALDAIRPDSDYSHLNALAKTTDERLKAVHQPGLARDAQGEINLGNANNQAILQEVITREKQAAINEMNAEFTDRMLVTHKRDGLKRDAQHNIDLNDPGNKALIEDEVQKAKERSVAGIVDDNLKSRGELPLTRVGSESGDDYGFRSDKIDFDDPRNRQLLAAEVKRQDAMGDPYQQALKLSEQSDFRPAMLKNEGEMAMHYQFAEYGRVLDAARGEMTTYNIDLHRHVTDTPQAEMQHRWDQLVLQGRVREFDYEVGTDGEIRSSPTSPVIPAEVRREYFDNPEYSETKRVYSSTDAQGNTTDQYGIRWVINDPSIHQKRQSPESDFMEAQAREAQAGYAVPKRGSGRGNLAGLRKDTAQQQIDTARVTVDGPQVVNVDGGNLPTVQVENAALTSMIELQQPVSMTLPLSGFSFAGTQSGAASQPVAMNVAPPPAATLDAQQKAQSTTKAPAFAMP